MDIENENKTIYPCTVEDNSVYPCNAEETHKTYVDTKYHFDSYIDDKQFPCDADDGYKTYVGNSLESVLETYDSDTTDKSLHFNGYKTNMDGKWFRVKDEDMTVYYFERDSD